MKQRLHAAVFGALFLGGLCSPTAFAAAGPSSSTPPYLLPLAKGVELVSILSVGDAVKRPQGGDYRMVGVPDGLGAFDNGDGTFTLLMNHELAARLGVARSHGGRGAFVSQWTLRKRDLKVLEGQDLIRSVRLWDPDAGRYMEAKGIDLNRFCSADLAPQSAFFNRKSAKGFSAGRIFLNGEEGDLGTSRGFAHVVGGPWGGTSYELPLLGRHPFENLLANPFEQDRTVVAATEDGGDRKVYFFIGEKQAKGNPVERAGLAQGRTYQLAIEGYGGDDPEAGFRSGRFKLAGEGGTTLARPEDGAWDTRDPNVFYFVTTSSLAGNSRLWEVRFDDIRQPERGGNIRVLIDGEKRGAKMLDNLTVDDEGSLYLQEDVGSNPHLGRIWKFSPKTGSMTPLAEHDPARFLKGGAGFLTENEESSGIIDVSRLFRGVPGYDTHRNRYFLLTVQAHYPLGGELVEGGELLLMKVPR